MSKLIAEKYKCFEDIKRVRPDGSEYWCARELACYLIVQNGDPRKEIIALGQTY